jgi:hypothetical protein
MSAPCLRAPWLALIALGACSSAAAPTAEREPADRDERAPPAPRPEPADEPPRPPSSPPAPSPPPARPRSGADAASARMIAVRDRPRLLALSQDRKRALLAVLQPVAHAPELRVVDIDAGKPIARVEMFSLMRLPRRAFLDEDPDHDSKLDAAIRGNRLLGEELANAGALLADFGGLHGGDFAASADGKHVAYTADEHSLRLAREGDPGGQRLDGGADPWTAPDGTTLLFKDGDPYKGTSTLWAVPFAGGKPARVQGTDHLWYHSDPIARPDGTLRVRSEQGRSRQPCLVDIDPPKLRVTRTICLPHEHGWPPELALSPGGDRVAWIDVDEDRKRSRLRAMDLATRKITIDTTAIDFTPVLDDKQLLVTDAGRIYIGVETRGFVIEPSGTARRVTHDPALRDCRVRNERELVCLRDIPVVDAAVVVVDVAAQPGTPFRLR